jgi:hypothetical protein
MTRLRTDLPLIPDQEMKDWVQDIVENTHYRDIETLRLKLDQAIESHNKELDRQLITSAN